MLVEMLDCINQHCLQRDETIDVEVALKDGFHPTPQLYNAHINPLLRDSCWECMLWKNRLQDAHDLFPIVGLAVGKQSFVLDVRVDQRCNVQSSRVSNVYRVLYGPCSAKRSGVQIQQL